MTSDNKSDPPTLVDSKVGSLLFADDLIILSESKEGLQHSMNNLSLFCDNWKLTINIGKTKSMVIQQNNIKKDRLLY